MGVAWLGLTALIAAIAAILWARSRRRPTGGPLGHRTTWLPTRDGLVCFEPARTALYPWDAVGSASLHADGVALELLAHPPAWVTAHGRTMPPAAGLRILDPAELGDRDPPTFVEVVRGARTDPAVRAALPTFAHPDGPPEAVLAGLPEA